MAFLSSLFIYGTEFFRGCLPYEISKVNFRIETKRQKSKHFYTTVKPFLSKKSTGSQQKIVLVENDKLVGKTLVLIVLLTSVVICLLSTGAPARKSLDEI
jgi:hypothetical protein